MKVHARYARSLGRRQTFKTFPKLPGPHPKPQTPNFQNLLVFSFPVVACDFDLLRKELKVGQRGDRAHSKADSNPLINRRQGAGYPYADDGCILQDLHFELGVLDKGRLPSGLVHRHGVAVDDSGFGFQGFRVWYSAFRGLNFRGFGSSVWR